LESTDRWQLLFGQRITLPLFPPGFRDSLDRVPPPKYHIDKSNYATKDTYRSCDARILSKQGLNYKHYDCNYCDGANEDCSMDVLWQSRRSNILINHYK